MAAFECRQEVPVLPGAKTTELTVGREFLLNCSGPWPEFSSGQALIEKLPENEIHSLKILDVKKNSATDFQLKVTSYRAGKNEIKNLIVTDGKLQAELGPVTFDVQSVINPQQPQEEAYGSIGPLGLSVPLLWWLLLATLLLAVGAWIGWAVYRRVQFKKMLLRLKDYDSALSPLAEFHQSLRRLQRTYGIFSGAGSSGESQAAVQDLEKAFRIYLLRFYHVPAFEWTDRLVLRALKRTHPEMIKSNGASLSRLLKEFGSAKTSTTLDPRDVFQLLEQSRAFAEILNKQGGR